MAVVIVPDEVHLFVLLGRSIGDNHGNLNLVFLRIGKFTDQDIAGIIGGTPHIAGLKPDFESGRSGPPGLRFFAEKFPAIAHELTKLLRVGRICRLRKEAAKSEGKRTDEFTHFHFKVQG